MVPTKLQLQFQLFNINRPAQPSKLYLSSLWSDLSMGELVMCLSGVVKLFQNHDFVIGDRPTKSGTSQVLRKTYTEELFQLFCNTYSMW